MNIHTRRAIALIFIAIFFIFTPILILYTSGYRYDNKKRKIERTGALVLESEPKKATIFINNKQIEKTTPARLNNILPGEYHIEIKKDGYTTWGKKLIVKSQETTFAEDVLLFPINLPKTIFNDNIEWINFSPNQKFAVFLTKNFEQDYLYLFDLTSGGIELIFNENKKLNNPEIVWSPNDLQFLLKDTKNLIIFSTFSPKNFKSLNSLINPDSFEFKWDSKENIFLYAINETQIIKINTQDNNTTKILQADKNQIFQDFLFTDQYNYLINQLNNKSFLSIFDLEEQKIVKTLELNNDSYTIEDIINNKILLKEKKLNKFYIIDAELNKILFQKNSLINYDYHANDKLLLLYTNQELSYLKMSDSELNESIITRYSNDLLEASWHKSSNYIFTLQNNKIHLIELDQRDKHFVINLPYTKVTKLTIDNESKNIYFIQDNKLQQINIEQ